MNRRAILSLGDGKYFGRALIAVASAGLFDDADLWIFGWPSSSVEHLPGTIHFGSIVQVMREFGRSIRPSFFHPYFWRYGCLLWLMRQGYEQVLSLDSDCLMVDHVPEMWDAADHNGIAACRDISTDMPQDLVPPGDGPFRATLAAAIARSGPEIRDRLFRLIGLTDADGGHPYVNAGVLALNSHPTMTALLHDYLEYALRCGSFMRRLTWPDQDLLNALLAKRGIRADMLNPSEYNFFPDLGDDKRILHWAGEAHDGILHLWRPYRPLIDQALRRLDTTLDAVVEQFPVE